MRELIEKGTSAEAHPSQWAPFVVVGEGGEVTVLISKTDPQHLARSASQAVILSK